MTFPALLLAALVTAQAAPAPEPAVSSLGAVEVFSCDFEEGIDLNYDRWPDGWTRRRDVEHPSYLPVMIVEDAATHDSALRIELDGGAAVIYSTPIAVSDAFSYVLDARLRTTGLEYNVAYYSLTFYSADRVPRQTFYSQQLTTADEWTEVEIGPVHPEHTDVEIAVIGLHLRPTDDFDLRGSAEFDKLRLSRRPRMTLTSNSPHNVYRGEELVEFTCEYSGVTQRNPQIAFEVIDITASDGLSESNEREGVIVAQHTVQGGQQDVSAEPMGTPMDTPMTMGQPTDEAPSNGYSGSVSWQPPITNRGCYVLRVTMLGEDEDRTPLHQRTTMFAMVPKASTPSTGEFGWSLSRGDDPLELAELVDLLSEVGVNWVKFPVWYTPEDQRRADELGWFAERLSAQRINMVGMLDQPPEEIRDRFMGEGDMLAANVFQEPELWHPALNPVTTRLSLKVHWWQLGNDTDTSFMSYPALIGKIEEIKTSLERFGQEMQIGLGWNWMYEAPSSAEVPWSFLSYTSDPPLTPAELNRYLSSANRASQRWIILQPLPRSEYSSTQRARDLVQRMLAAKLAGAEAIFVPDPFDEETGLMNPDGTPGELLLPWRTAALQLAGSNYLGSIELPGGSANHIFTRGDEAVMVIWNDTPTEETIYLGEGIEQLDLWGRSLTLGDSSGEQIISVGPLPTFVTGLNRYIAEVRMSCEFDTEQLASIFSRPQRIVLTLQNPFSQGISGSARLVLPEDWGEPDPVLFESPSLELVQSAFSIELKADAVSGLRPVRIDFDINAEQNYRFSVYRTLEIGLGDISLEFTTTMGDNGELIIEQYLANQSAVPSSFNCYIFAPGRRRIRQQVLGLSQGRAKIRFILPEAAELSGQTVWLRAEEIDGERVLNQRIDVPMPQVPAPLDPAQQAVVAEDAAQANLAQATEDAAQAQEDAAENGENISP